MNYKINNTLFERKHHYVTILKESELLKQQMNEEMLDGAVSASRLDEINHICNLAFAGLLQEGLEFRYSRDTNPSKEALIMTIDHVDYRCRVTALRGILRDKLDDYLNGTAPKEEPVPKEQSKKETAPYIPDLTESLPEENRLSMETETRVEAEVKEKLPRSRFSFGSAEGRIGLDTPNAQSEDAGYVKKREPDMPSSFTVPEEEEEEENSDNVENLLLANLLRSLGSGDADFFDEEEDEEEEEENDAPLPSEMRAAAAMEQTVKEPEQTVSAEQTADVNPAPAAEPVPEPEIDWSVDIEEKEKHKNTFCYEVHRIVVSRGGTRNEENALGEQVQQTQMFGEEIFFMVAPTEIERTSETRASVPIVVYAYYNGKSYYSGSFKNDAGKLLVQINVGDYNFLVRGIFKDRKFESHICTTGNSMAEDIVLNSLERTAFNPPPARVRNGHIRFVYEGKDNEQGTIEVYPVNEGDNNFIVLQEINHPQRGVFKYQYCTEDNKKILLSTKDGTRELICWWDGDMVKAEVVPA